MMRSTNSIGWLAHLNVGIKQSTNVSSGTPSQAGQEVHRPPDGGRPDLEGHPGPDAHPRRNRRPPVAPKKAKTTKGATNKVATPTVRDGSKRAMVLELIRRADGPAFRRSWPRPSGRRPRLHLRQPQQAGIAARACARRSRRSPLESILRLQAISHREFEVVLEGWIAITCQQDLWRSVCKRRTTWGGAR